MISVVILGQPFAAARIARALNHYASDIRARFLSPKEYVAFLARPPRADHVVLMRAGYRVGATTPRGRLFDAYWDLICRAQPGAARCHYWIGSDVMKTVEAFAMGSLRSRAFEAARGDLHLTVAPWLTEELASIGVQATTALLPPPLHIPEVAPPLPRDFSALTYLPAHRFDFFGGPVIMEAARRLPHIRFDVVASQHESRWSAPSSVRWHGWVSDMSKRYAEASVIIRLPAHDGFGKTVIEGLLNARHILYTQTVPFVRKVWPVSVESLEATLTELHDSYADGRLVPNVGGRAYALDTFNLSNLGRHLQTLIRATAR